MTQSSDETVADLSYFAEAGTDEYLRDVFFPDFSRKGTIVEVGGGDPILLSMSRHWMLNGWRVIVVEPNPIFAQKHRDIGNEVHECACGPIDEEMVRFTVVHGNEMSWFAFEVKDGAYAGGKKEPCHEIMVRKRKLGDLLSETKCKRRFEILSVDVEGWEMEVMQGFDLDWWRPRVVVMENLSKMSSYREYMEKHWYRFVRWLHLNQIYVAEEHSWL